MDAAFRNDGCGGASAMSSSSSAPLRTLRQRMSAPTTNSTATMALTTASGSSVSRLPAVTAISDWTANARPTPVNTGHGLNRVASTSVANSVLSGSSTGSTRMNAAATTDRSTTTPLATPSDRRPERNATPAVRYSRPQRRGVAPNVAVDILTDSGP